MTVLEFLIQGEAAGVSGGARGAKFLLGRPHVGSDA